MIRRLLRNEFNRNVLTLMTGTTVAQAIPVAISPILTRIYTPDDFGVLALFIAISTIIGSVANAHYELAIVLPEKDEDAINIVALSLLIALLLSGLLCISIMLLHHPLITLLGNEQLSLWIYFIPLIVFLIGLFNALTYYNTRTKQYKYIARANMYKSVVLATVQLGLGILKVGAGGLITGQIFSHIMGNSRLGYHLLKDKKLLSCINIAEMKGMAKRYIKFPKFSMWAILANTLSYNLVNIFISTIYSVSTLGFYSLTNRVLGMPSTLVGKSIGQVYFQKATEEKNKTGRATDTFKSTFFKLALISVPLFTLLYILVEDLFSFVFGEEWRVAGEYARILLPLFFVRFFLSPLSMTNIIFEKQKIQLIWQLTLLILTISVFLIANMLELKIRLFLHLFTWTLIFNYLVFFVILIQVSKGR